MLLYQTTCWFSAGTEGMTPQKKHPFPLFGNPQNQVSFIPYLSQQKNGFPRVRGCGTVWICCSRLCSDLHPIVGGAIEAKTTRCIDSGRKPQGDHVEMDLVLTARRVWWVSKLGTRHLQKRWDTCCIEGLPISPNVTRCSSLDMWQKR